MKDKPSYLAKAFNARPLGMPIPPNWFGIGVRRIPRLDDFDLLFERATEFVIGVAGRQAFTTSPFLLIEFLALALGDFDHLGERGTRGQQLQVQPGHLPHIVDL